jgi:hypothetical protein
MNRMRRTSMRARAGRPWPAAVVALLAILALAPAAGAQQLTWLSPIGLENSGGSQAAQAVACSSASQCTSVDANGQQVTFNPASGASTGSSSIDLRGTVSSLACPSTTQCTGVDNLGNQVTFNPGSGALVDGGLQSAGGAHPLISVACPTVTECTAVDTQGGQVTFDPTTGSSTSSSDIDGAHALASVACAGDQSCTAVDDQGNATVYNPRTGVTSSSVLNVDTHALTSVSCEHGFCVAVDTAGQEILMPADGGPGTAFPIDGTTALTSVSCIAAGGQCTAVDGQGNEITFNPNSGVVASSQSVDGINRLSGVACPVAINSQCTAIDTHGNEVTFNPSSGASIGGGLHSVAPNALASLACPLATQCTAVEAGGREITFDPTAGHVTGQDGHGTIGPSIVDATGNRLTSVSCSSATQCTAVDTGAFEETFNPQNGKLNAAGGSNRVENGQSLESVSCPTAVQCTAVDEGGNQVTFNPQLAVPNSVNNVSPNQVDGTPDRLLVSIVCLTDHSCVAVDHGGAEVSFDPNSINAGTPTEIETDHHPSALSCASATQCTAVDDAGQATTFDPTTVANTQTNIAGPTSVDPAGGLDGVSCPSSAACVAVDGHGNSVQFAPASPGGAVVEPVPEAAALQAVSCLTVYECAAVDSGGNAFAGFLPPASSAAPTITGTAQQGQTLTEHHGTWANSPATSYTYQWQDCDDSGCSAIPGAAGSTYTLQPSDVGEAIAVQETATNIGGVSQPASSARTSVVLPPAPVRQGPPTIVGTVAQGQTLTEQHGLWLNNPAGYGYQWQVCDSAGHGCTSIAGATGRSYVPQASDIGKALVVQETASNPGGTSPAAGSEPTAPVAAARAANILAVTSEADHLSSHSAQLHGVLYSQGAPASWQFEYGTTTALGHKTPLQSLAAGNMSAIGVLSSLANLRPGTTYYVRLDETVSPGTYRTGVQSKGRVLAFTTSLAGQLRLQRSLLTVTSRGALASLGCSAPVDCTGQLTLTLTRATGGTRHPRARVVRCGRLAVSLHRGRSRQFTVPLSGACRSLLRRPGPQALLAELTGDSTSGQAGFSKEVELSG